MKLTLLKYTILFVAGLLLSVSPYLVGTEVIHFVRWLNTFPLLDRFPMEFWAMYATFVVICTGIGIMLGSILMAADRRRRR
jgi:hypothetical protein